MWSHEAQPLETAGGIINALPLLGEVPFMVVNGDVWTDYPFAKLAACKLANDAHLVLVDNPPQHPLGDYSLDDEGQLSLKPPESVGYTYAGLGLYTPRFFAGTAPGKLALRPLLDNAIVRGTVGAEYYAGDWVDVGTPGRLEELDERVSHSG